MVSIFICEDKLEQKNGLEKIIKDYVNTEKLNMKIELSTDDPMAVLNYVHENVDLGGLYFLGVGLNHEMDGISLAVKLRTLDPSGKIVFVTAHAELAFLTFKYKIEALDYIIKGTDLEEIKKKIEECVQIAYERQLASKESSRRYFMVKSSDKINVIPLEEIMYFKVSEIRDRLILHLEGSKIQFRGFLKDVEDYHCAFVRIHHAIVANKHNIKSIDSKKMEVEFVNGATCGVSARKLKVLEKALANE